jgi:hypothetical protein
LLLAFLAGRSFAADGASDSGSSHDLSFRIAPGNISPAPSEPDTEVIVPGENLLVRVAEDPTFDGTYQVRRGGYIIMPQLGRIAVAGKTLAVAEAAVQRALQSTQLPKASVKIVRREVDDLKNRSLDYLRSECSQPRLLQIFPEFVIARLHVIWVPILRSPIGDCVEIRTSDDPAPIVSVHHDLYLQEILDKFRPVSRL